MPADPHKNFSKRGIPAGNFAAEKENGKLSAMVLPLVFRSVDQNIGAGHAFSLTRSHDRSPSRKSFCPIALLFDISCRVNDGDPEIHISRYAAGALCACE